MRETDLYPPVKAYLEAQGYEVKGEVTGCDVVAVRGDEPPVVVELKTTLSLPLILQAVDRLAMTDTVYIAFPDRQPGAKTSPWRQRRKQVLGLCKRLGLGVLLLRQPKRANGRIKVEALLDPMPYAPRRNARRAGRLIKEFAERVGDPNAGGVTRTRIMTAYRQDAIRCARHIAASGPSSPRAIRDATGVERAAAILQNNVYGWFERIARGSYDLSPKGEAALADYAGILDDLAPGVAKVPEPA